MDTADSYLPALRRIAAACSLEAQPEGVPGGFDVGTTALQGELFRRSTINPYGHPDLPTVSAGLRSDPELAPLLPVEGELEPMACWPGGGSRFGIDMVLMGLLASARSLALLAERPLSADEFASLVQRGLGELKGALKEGRAPIYDYSGFGGVTLQAGTRVETPWGTLRPAPIIRPIGDRRPVTTVLVEAVEVVPIVFDRSANPEPGFAPWWGTSAAQLQLALACALAVDDAIAAAVWLWSSAILTFDAGMGGSGAGWPMAGVSGTVDVTPHAAGISEWAAIVASEHRPSVDIAMRRLLSAIGSRPDPADMLIDAVMVWENLLGTRSESTFRVTAALAKLLHGPRDERVAAQTRYKRIYDVRSRVVHGDAVDGQTLTDASRDAIDIALDALRVSYRRGGPWLELTSTERADRLLLSEP